MAPGRAGPHDVLATELVLADTEELPRIPEQTEVQDPRVSGEGNGSQTIGQSLLRHSSRNRIDLSAIYY